MVCVPKDYFGVGLDESGHGAKKRVEIVVAIFSECHEDCIARDFSKRRDQSDLETVIQNGAEITFAVLTGNKYRLKPCNLGYQAPKLIEYIMSLKNFKTTSLEIFLDGKPPKDYEEELFKNLLKKRADYIKVNNYPKSHNKRANGLKQFHQPRIVRAADVMASNLFDLPFDELIQHPNLAYVAD